MANDYLTDYTFLEQLDKSPVRTHYAKLTLLSFDELPIKEIQGEITTGTLNVNGNSPIRRTLSLTMRGSPLNSDLEDIDNEISINKKIKVEIGLKNTLQSYSDYGDIIWFPCGIFVLSSASLSRATNAWTISISGKDKMCMLDGSVGGTIPAATAFHDREEEQADGTIVYTYPTVYQIIYEAVNHFGDEKPENIVIEDLEETAKLLVRYIGSSAIYFDSNYSGFSYQKTGDFQNLMSTNDDAGFEMTDFTYPGELVLKAGDSVVTLLDKIVKTLGSNFEFFYDLDGRFIFREIRNYLNKQSPLDELQPANYFESYNREKYSFSLTDLGIVTQLRKNPKFDSIKNNYYVWGKRTTASGADVPIRYHLAIDEKPELNLVNYYMYRVTDAVPTQVEGEKPAGTSKTPIIQIYQPGNTILRYEFKEESSLDGPYPFPTYIQATGDAQANTLYFSDDQGTIADPQPEVGSSLGDNYYIAGIIPSECWTLITPPAPQGGWREELYRLALQAQATNGVYDNAYDAEMIAEWRKLFDPDNEDWAPLGWNPAIDHAPSSLDFWIDIIDTEALAKYSVKQIGRRTQTVQNDSLNSIYNKDVPQLLFISSTATEDERAELIDFAQKNGLKYFQLTNSVKSSFASSTTNKSCFEEIREQMYQHLTYNTTINFSCLPKYYLEPNNVVFINDQDTGIYGNYLITQFSIPLTYNGIMQVTATEVLNRDNIGGSL